MSFDDRAADREPDTDAVRFRRIKAVENPRHLLGGKTARDPLEGAGAEAIADAVAALTLDCERVGDDLLVSARMREW